jgi:hypothetical protein
MTTPVRAIYENGHLRLVDPVEPKIGQIITVQLVEVVEEHTKPVHRKHIPNLFPGIIASDDFDDELPDSFWLGEDE